jgi:hypothetical protein
LRSDKIIGVTSVSGSFDRIPAHRKVQATLPFINPSNAPEIELLREQLTPVSDSVQQDTVAEGGTFTSGSSSN